MGALDLYREINRLGLCSETTGLNIDEKWDLVLATRRKKRRRARMKRKKRRGWA